jgi:hypothetical protein
MHDTLEELKRQTSKQTDRQICYAYNAEYAEAYFWAYKYEYE